MNLREMNESRKEYRKLWMRSWRLRNRKSHLDNRKSNGKNQIRINGRFSVCIDDIR